MGIVVEGSSNHTTLILALIVTKGLALGHSSRYSRKVWESRKSRGNKPIKTTFEYLGVSKNRGTSKSSILIGFSIINHPFWGTPIFGNIHFDTTSGTTNNLSQDLGYPYPTGMELARLRTAAGCVHNARGATGEAVEGLFFGPKKYHKTNMEPKS